MDSFRLFRSQLFTDINTSDANIDSLFTNSLYSSNLISGLPAVSRYIVTTDPLLIGTDGIYSSIQDAIDAAAVFATALSPQVVLVQGGTYTENVTLASYVALSSVADDVVDIVGSMTATNVDTQVQNINVTSSSGSALIVAMDDSSNLKIIRSTFTCTDATVYAATVTGTGVSTTANVNISRTGIDGENALGSLNNSSTYTVSVNTNSSLKGAILANGSTNNCKLNILYSTHLGGSVTADSQATINIRWATINSQTAGAPLVLNNNGKMEVYNSTIRGTDTVSGSFVGGSGGAQLLLGVNNLHGVSVQNAYAGTGEEEKRITGLPLNKVVVLGGSTLNPGLDSDVIVCVAGAAVVNLPDPTLAAGFLLPEGLTYTVVNTTGGTPTVNTQMNGGSAVMFPGAATSDNVPAMLTRKYTFTRQIGAHPNGAWVIQRGS